MLSFAKLVFALNQNREKILYFVSLPFHSMSEVISMTSTISRSGRGMVHVLAIQDTNLGDPVISVIRSSLL